MLILPQRNPVEIAKQIATIDDLSNGRVMLAVGVGWSQGEYANLGYDFHNRGSRMDEAIRVLKTLWSGEESISFHGRYYDFKNAVISPPPIQAGGPPVWVGGSSLAAMRRAVSLGDGWHPNAQSPSALREALQTVQSPDNFTVCPGYIWISAGRFAGKRPARNNSKDNPSDSSLSGCRMTGAVIAFDTDNTAARLQMLKQFAQEVMPEFH